MEMDLSELARMKIKLDIYTKLYKQQTDAIKQQLKDKNDKEVDDPEHGLKLKLIDSTTREFSVEGIKKVFGEEAICIEESVNAKKFDALAKKNKEYTITEEQQKQCFMMVPKSSLSWDGLDVYRSKLK